MENFAPLFMARSIAYRILQALFAEPLSGDIADIACDSTVAQAFSVLDGFAPNDQSGSLPGAWDAAADCLSRPAAIEDAASWYTRLFIGPGKLPAPPWESCYVAHRRLLFQESTLEVRRAYGRMGFRARGFPRVADDHLALELDFMSALSEQMALFDEGRPMPFAQDESCRKALNASIDFLEKHLLRWVGPWSAALVMNCPENSLYAAASQAVNLACEADFCALKAVCLE